MNVAELFGVVYLAIKAGGVAADDAVKALLGVGVWIVLGVAWVAFNPQMRGAKLLDATAEQRPVLSGVCRQRQSRFPKY